MAVLDTRRVAAEQASPLLYIPLAEFLLFTEFAEPFADEYRVR